MAQAFILIVTLVYCGGAASLVPLLVLASGRDRSQSGVLVPFLVRVVAADDRGCFD